MKSCACVLASSGIAAGFVVNLSDIDVLAIEACAVDTLEERKQQGFLPRRYVYRPVVWLVLDYTIVLQVYFKSCSFPISIAYGTERFSMKVDQFTRALDVKYMVEIRTGVVPLTQRLHSLTAGHRMVL